MTTTLTLTETHTQSLASGYAGQALLSVETALTGAASWADARAALRQLASAPIDASEHTGLYYGAPAVAFVLHAAQGDGRPRGQGTLTVLDGHASRLTRTRLAAAERRAASGAAPRLDEYDLFYGLTGLGVLLLERRPGSDVLADVLHYVIDLTREQVRDGVVVPGWWVDHDPDPAAPTPGGHANLGMAHGAAGLLAFLATAARRGVVVDGQHEAIATLQGWFDRWRQAGPDGVWWPQWLTRDELRAGRLGHQHIPRPSWCYGTPGIARAIQIAAIATGDHIRRAGAEAALASCLTARQVARLTDAGLCHGIAGLYQTAFRAAQDAADPAVTHHLTVAAESLTRTARPDRDLGFLTGSAGLDLALSTLRTSQPPASGWDACLLIS